MTRICLNLIVKNEATIIGRLLRSALPLVDCVCIADTGSTDGTQQVIRNFCEANRLPHDVHQIEFRDFGQARNEALQHVQNDPHLCCPSMPGSLGAVDCSPLGRSDYILFADADHEFRGSIDRTALTAPAYSLRITDGGMSYWRERLVRRDLAAKYVGVTHEYLDLAGHVPVKIDTAHVQDHANGSNRGDKFTRDIRLLTEGLKAEPDNARYLFYLARSYQDLGQFANAINHYLKRINLRGWDEEVWYSCYMRAICSQRLGNEGEFIRCCWEAYNARPWRAEPLYAMAKHFRESRQYDACLAVCEIGERVPYPTDDVLFIEDRVYRVGFREEQSIAGFYSRDPRRRVVGRTCCEVLASGDDAAARELAQKNLAFYQKA